MVRPMIYKGRCRGRRDVAEPVQHLNK